MTANAATFEFPPGSGRWYKPGPVMEARWLGRWPSAGTYGVWSEALWDAATGARLPLPSVAYLPRIGCDVARFGDDWTTFHVRVGDVSLHHEGYNGRDTMQTVGRLVALATEYSQWHNARLERSLPTLGSKQMLLVVDDDGVGGGVTDRLREQGYNVRPVRAGSIAKAGSDYPNLRSELWFASAERARAGKMDLHRLPTDLLQRLRAQAMAPEWKLDSAGRRVVEPKDVTKKKVKRSPDDMDALNLAYLERAEWTVKATPPTPEKKPGGSSRAAERGMMGRGEGRR